MKPLYNRILIKLSGEQLAGATQGGIDTTFVAWIASQLATVTELGVEVVVMVGGGNYARGAQLAGNGILPVTAHNVGMLATMMNALVLGDIFNANNLPTRVVSTVIAEQVADPFTYRRAMNHLGKGRVLIVAGGIGRPFLTTDTAAVNLALELDCDIVCKATKVDGVYDKDPAKFPDAKKIHNLTFQEAVENQDILVMDKAALGLAMEQKKKIIVFGLQEEGAIRQVVLGEQVGTLIQN